MLKDIDFHYQLGEQLSQGKYPNLWEELVQRVFCLSIGVMHASMQASCHLQASTVARMTKFCPYSC